MINNKAIANLDHILGYIECMNDAGMITDEMYQDRLVKLYNVRGTLEQDFKRVDK